MTFVDLGDILEHFQHLEFGFSDVCLGVLYTFNEIACTLFVLVASQSHYYA